MSDFIEFHDAYLVAHHLGPRQSLSLQIQLDPVWNRDSDRVIQVGLHGIINLPEVDKYFSAINRAHRHVRLIQQRLASEDAGVLYEQSPTVMRFDFLEVDGAFLVCINLLFWGTLDVMCEEIKCDKRSSLRFVR